MVSEFPMFRSQLQQSRRQLEQDKQSLFLTEEKRKQIETQQAQLDRTFDPDREADRAEQKRLQTLHDQTVRQIDRLGEQVATTDATLQATLDRFAVLSDPRERVEQLSDLYPVLLLPLRIETRFKQVQSGTGVQYQLWVRVFPDDCAVDTFEAALSKTEVRNARRYWAQVWRAGKDETLRRAAWRNLVGSHGSGRALWIVENYRPLNEDQIPERDDQTIVLVIPTGEPLTGSMAEQTAIFWERVWRAHDDAVALRNAQNFLAEAVGEEQAQRILKDYRPFNLDDPPPAGSPDRAETAVIVTTIAFESDEATQTKRRAWSRAPQVSVLPDRLVLMGYSGNSLTLQALGNPIPSPLIVGPDPLAAEDDQIRQEGDDIAVSSAMRWMVDFEEAVRVGMGFRVNLSQAQYAAGFDKLLVLGVRLSSDETNSKQIFEQLLRSHHYSRGGLSLIRQGTPTNNTDEQGSGFSSTADADASYETLTKSKRLFERNDDWYDRADGQWWAELLGIDLTLLQQVQGANQTDVRDAQAMNLALFPATLGYFMDTMLAQVFDDRSIEFVRQFFTRFVSGRGMLSAIRMGQQPYGILPATVYSRMNWSRQEGFSAALFASVGSSGSPGLAKLYEVLMRAYGVWGTLRDRVSYVGKSGDPHQILLDVLGLHPTSVEFDQRYAESLAQVINTFNLQGWLDQLLVTLSLLMQGTQILRDHGYDPDRLGRPDLLDKYFFAKPYAVNPENLIHDLPLSETEGIRAYTADKRNYIQWLIDAARTSLETIRQQAGLDEKPTSLLYLMLKHALTLGYYDTALRLNLTAGNLSQPQLQQIRREANFIHIAAGTESSESRYKLLYDNIANIPDRPAGQTVADYITSILSTADDAARLQEQILALERLQNLSTAQLERAFVEHLDTCTYRLDAWLQGLVQYQLAVMRYVGVDEEEQARSGLYLGAFGWLEAVRPKNKAQTPVSLRDPELAKVFNREGDVPLVRDADNLGYVHAPSPNHAVTAAVLRNGYARNATPEDPGVFAVNLSSERVRRAMAIVEGMHSGQSLAALLGYQFERGLHDRYEEAEVDQFIFKLRKAFPLVADRIRDTARPVEDSAADTQESIEAIEARNVIDGVALVEHIQSTGNATYPFGKNWLPPAEPAQQNAINAEVRRLLDTHDAVADLGIAEGIHQVVQGNYDRAAASVDAFASGDLPPIPDVVQTPRSGKGLTHRVGLHLQPGLLPTDSPIGLAVTPRASAEPAINHWLARLLPPPDRVGVRVSYVDADGMTGQQIVTQAELGLQPIDLLYLLNLDGEQGRTALDDQIVKSVSAGKRPDTPITILYTQRIAPRFAFFELAALMSELRGLLLGARSLNAADLILPNEADSKTQPLPEYRTERLNHVRDRLTASGNPVQPLRTLISELTPLLSDPRANRTALISNIDDRLNRFIESAAALNQFGLPQTGYGFALDWKRLRYRALIAKIEDLLNRWQDKLDAFDTLLTQYDALPAATTDDDRFALLANIEAEVAIVLTDPLPANPADYRAIVIDRRAQFIAKRNQFAALRETSTPNLATLLADLQSTSTNLTDFDFVRLELDPDGDEIVRFSGDLLTNAQNIVTDIEARLAKISDRLTAYGTVTTARDRESAFTEAAHLLLGDDFQVVPEFQLGSAQADELQKAYTDKNTLLTYLTATLNLEFPVDEWLYGVARVRSMMQHWETATMLSEAFVNRELLLHPLQLPYQKDDRWLALPYPPDLKFDTDKLLYTAHFAVPFDRTLPQCGLLLDEWTEIIPTTEETTSVAFHFDRPSAEPPQVMLLVTPPQINGRWEWTDLVDTLHETIELAKRRAIEPDQIASTDYARFLPATITAVTFNPITIALNYAVANQVYDRINLQTREE
ncbi:hypothetical protein NDI45_24660 [Leptolyngbya sp. GB1-A1]|uniref:hypothetical protein n=1 Tax=Leptolyngbya sp. GB1-A1 TaxID=2933908 RepID=UPI0032978633